MDCLFVSVCPLNLAFASACHSSSTVQYCNVVAMVPVRVNHGSSAPAASRMKMKDNGSVICCCTIE